MEIREYFLKPGELLFSKVPTVVKTVLGSCVSVCIFDNKKKYAGICHYLLPDSAGNSASTKYGNVALNLLIERFVRERSDIKNLEAHIAGGSFIIFQENSVFFIGDNNVEIARKILGKYGIRIKSTNTGGEQGKRVLFNTRSGLLLVEPIKVLDISDLYNPDI